MPDSRHIYLIETEQLPIVQALAQRIWPDAYAGILSAAQIQNLLQSIYSLPALQDAVMRGQHFWLCEQNGVAAGFCSAYQQNNILWLRALYVLPQWQGTGMGRAFMEVAHQHFSTAQHIKLNVNVANQSAIHAYQSWGFEIAKRVPVRMGDYDFEDFIMHKSLV